MPHAVIATNCIISNCTVHPVKTRSRKPKIQIDMHLKTYSLTCAVVAATSMQKHQHAHGFTRLGLFVKVHIHQLPAIRCRGTQKCIHSHLLEESSKIWGLRLWCGRDLGRVVCQNPLCILPGLIIMVEDLHDEFMVGQFLVLPFLQLDLRASPRFDALHMHWIRHTWVHVIGLVAGVPILVIPIPWILLNCRWDTQR